MGEEFSAFVTPEDAPRAREQLERVLQGEAPKPFELRLRAKNSRLLVVEVTATPQLQDGRVIGGLGIARDVTERKQGEKQIRAALEEKEVLFREINHRVKNNLQVVSSLLNLQSRQTADPIGLEILRESRNRIQAMALIHEKLYRSESLARIDFGDYVGSLTEHLLQSYGARARQIRLTPRIASIKFGTDTRAKRARGAIMR